MLNEKKKQDDKKNKKKQQKIEKLIAQCIVVLVCDRGGYYQLCRSEI